MWLNKTTEVSRKTIVSAIKVILIIALVGTIYYNSSVNNCDKTLIFYEELERIGLFDAIEYRISKDGIYIMNQDSTVHFYLGPTNIRDNLLIFEERKK